MRPVTAAAILAIAAGGAFGLSVALRGTNESADLSHPDFGYNDDWEDFAANSDPANDPVQLVKAEGANAARYAFQWSRVQSYDPNAPGGFGPLRFPATDPHYEALIRAGIRPIIIVEGGPSNAPACNQDAQCTPPRMVKRCPGSGFDPAKVQDSKLDQSYPGILEHWQAYVQGVADHFPDAKGIEVWNEENGPTFWGGCAANVDEYANLVKAAYEGVHAHNLANPSNQIPLLLGGTLPAERSGSLPIRFDTFIRDVLAKLKAAYGQPLVDVVAIHPYRNIADLGRGPDKPAQFASSAEDQLALARRAAGDLPVWVTEVGASTSGPTSDPHFAGDSGDIPGSAAVEAKQTAVLEKIYTTLRDAQVPVVLIHSFSDDITQDLNGTWLEGPGVVTPSAVPTNPTTFTLKPAYCALAADRGVSPSVCR
jgi:hypothetical protein